MTMTAHNTALPAIAADERVSRDALADEIIMRALRLRFDDPETWDDIVREARDRMRRPPLTTRRWHDPLPET